MYQRDYILRLVAMLGEMLAGILGLIRKGDTKQASDKLRKVYGDFLKENSEPLRSIPEEDLLSQLGTRENFTAGHYEMLAEIFRAEGELCHATGDLDGARAFYRKSLLLFRHADRESRTYSRDRQDKMEKLQEGLENLGPQM